MYFLCLYGPENCGGRKEDEKLMHLEKEREGKKLSRLRITFKRQYRETVKLGV